MNARFLTQVAVATGLAAPIGAAAADVDPLVAERWKTRPIVVVAPQPADPLLAKVDAALAEPAAQEAFKDREMVLYTVVAGQGSRNRVPLKPEQTQSLLKAVGLQAAGPATFVLVGKDGEVKMKEVGDVDLKQVFAEIDRMPMRRQRTER